MSNHRVTYTTVTYTIISTADRPIHLCTCMYVTVYLIVSYYVGLCYHGMHILRLWMEKMASRYGG